MTIETLYNNILSKSRTINYYTECGVKDILDNKIVLLLIYFSFIFNKLKNVNLNYSQKIFDFIFYKIETDLREIGIGDMSVNKKMKIIVNKFYSILIDFDSFIDKKDSERSKLIINLLKTDKNDDLKFLNIIGNINNFAKKIDLISIDDIYNGNF